MKKLLVVAFASVAMVAMPQPGEAAPVTFVPALPVADNELVYRQQLVWVRATDDPSPKNRRLNVVASPLVLGYGITERVTVFGALPFLHKRLKLDTPKGTKTRSTTGFGDMKTFVRFTALQIDSVGTTTRVGAFAGSKLPTGADDEADGLGRFPQPFQLGTGSWDPLGGVAFTHQTLRWAVDSSVRYTFPTEANSFRAGDSVEGNVSFQYRLLPWGQISPKSGIPPFLFGILEANAVWRDHSEVAGKVNPNSGGTTVFLTPAVRLGRKRWVVESAFQFPVVQELNGSALGKNFTGRISFRANF